MAEKMTIDGWIRTGLEESAVSGVTDKMVEALSFYAVELERWNRKMNLTGKQTAAQIVADLLYDTFYVYGHLHSGRSVLDMGSGAGVISIPFAILDPALHVISVDASTKKIQFQRHVKRTLELNNLTLYDQRVEHLESQRVEVVIAKAFGTTKDVLAKAARHLKDDGRILLLKGKSESPTHAPGFQLEETVNYFLPRSMKEFKLITYKKVP